jgi:hypothetical protein
MRRFSVASIFSTAVKKIIEPPKKPYSNLLAYEIIYKFLESHTYKLTWSDLSLCLNNH